MMSDDRVKESDVVAGPHQASSCDAGTTPAALRIRKIQLAENHGCVVLWGGRKPRRPMVHKHRQRHGKINQNKTGREVT